MEPIIEIQDLSFSYSGGPGLALDNINLGIQSGEFLGIIGPSGAGKSTLAGALSGSIPHRRPGSFYGTALIEGKDTCETALTDIARIVGSVGQDIDAQMVASVVEDEILYGLENFGVAHSEIEHRVSGALETVGITDLRYREIATLSGGQKQKVAIAAMLALSPRVIVLDEPTAALDPASARMVFETLREINRSHGITIVVIEQMVALLSRYCGRIAVMDEGRIVLDGTPREVFSHGRTLQEIGVDSPRVARVSNSLAGAGLCSAGDPCLTVDEAADLILRICGDHAARIPVPGSARTASDETAAHVLEVREASFSYPEGGASVEKLDMHVGTGEIVAVVGRNGAGKTTLTKLANGLLKPLSGSISICGLDTRTTPVSTIAGHASTLFQNPDRQICRETVLDEVAFGLELQGIPPAAARERAQPVIERFGLPGHIAPFSLSRGQRQLVALASVVVMRPELVILDEPTSGLDYRECMTVMQTVRDLAEEGCGVLMVCHDMEVVSDFADRLVVMSEGRILASGSADAVFADNALMKLASIEPPQVVELARALEQRGAAAFAGAREVSHIVDICKELVCHG